MNGHLDLPSIITSNADVYSQLKHKGLEESRNQMIQEIKNLKANENTNDLKINI